MVERKSIKKRASVKGKTKIKKTVKTKSVTKKSTTKKKVVRKTTLKKPPLRKKLTPLDLKKPKHNPIIEPREDAPWESKATFNPTAFTHNDDVHIFYRAIGDNDMSVLGYALSRDGVNIEERFPAHAFLHEVGKKRRKGRSPISYSSGGGWGGGCEDPRATKIDDTAYVLYTAFDGWGSVRIALTSIHVDDLENRKWEWQEPTYISKPGEIHKNWVLFPEKIQGKYAILHAISPKIRIHYADSMDEFDGQTFIESISREEREHEVRSKGIRGVGPAPIKTKYGWLVLYHAIEDTDPGKYKLWALLLDPENPEEVLFRSARPILEPDEEYENSGFKWGVVYSCGAIVKDGTLFVYYGGADKVSCVATADLNKFLNELMKTSTAKLRRRRILANK